MAGNTGTDTAAQAAERDDMSDLVTDLLKRAEREPLGVDISDYGDEWVAGFLAGQLNALVYVTHPEVQNPDPGVVLIPDEPDHFVTFDEKGWFIEHSVACRVAGTIGTCAYNDAIREIADCFDPADDPDQLGRWRITAIDDEGLPSMEPSGTRGIDGDGGKRAVQPPDHHRNRHSRSDAEMTAQNPPQRRADR